MSNNKSDYSTKLNHHTKGFKRRLKSSVVRDPNGSISTFRQFYQSGGRDYEQYRLWLQTLSNASIDSEKIKKEPIDSQSNKVICSSSECFSMARAEFLHGLFRPMKHLTTPIHTLSPLQLTTTSYTSQIQPSIVPISSSSLTNWSVNDVGRFIEKHFPEKNIARKFIEQKIDGRTLPLLTEDHLTRIFKMKLGPALYLLDLISNINK